MVLLDTGTPGTSREIHHIDDVIEVLNLKINDIFKNNTSSYIMLSNLKDTNVIRPS